ncbi:RNA-binding cell elongation regulator Jag/EloR [Chloroflexota bacterium]
MKSLKISGKTVEEAIQSALKTLGVSREEIEVTVLEEGRSGILGLGVEDAEVRVEVLTPVAEDKMEETARDVLGTLLDLLGVDATVESAVPPFAEEGQKVSPITFDVRGDDLGILIGRRGQTLSCLQYIVRLIVTHKADSWVPIFVDVEGYKQRRYEALQALARRMAEQVKAKKITFSMEPMSPYERRIVHLALADSPNVLTESTGEGEERKVVILPRK